MAGTLLGLAVGFFEVTTAAIRGTAVLHREEKEEAGETLTCMYTRFPTYIYLSGSFTL